MAIDKKYIGKITDDNLDDWLHSTGFLYPTNEKQLDRFNKLHEDYDFKLKDAIIDIKSIIEGTLCNKTKVISFDLGSDVSNEIQNLKMVARKGQDNLPKHIIDKMRGKHRDSDDTN
ncbi:hypothetical protein [Flavobacterium sp.]|uniref:hypothetical protein n=1 Tax=Flavobacterium sp. TaxID=239 RepID=UPI00286B067C|nr:hypothetical protein [Flavobacterium sp.]